MEMAKKRVPLILASALPVCCAAMLSVATQVPSLFVPFSLPVLVPSILFSIFALPHMLLIFLGASPLTLTYILCMLKGSKQDFAISNGAVVFITLSALVAVVFNAVSIQQGLAEQGWMHVLVISVLNLVFILALPMAYWSYRKSRTLFRYLRFYALYFIWLGYCAFPWYGQS